MYKNLSEIKGIHAGEDLYIIGSGRSLQYYDRLFFKNKICIGINHVRDIFPCKYSVCKDLRSEKELLDFILMSNGDILITPEYYDDFDNGEMISHKVDTFNDYYICKTLRNKGTVDVYCFGTDVMVQSHLTITTAINIAWYLGAANIILVGVDCGLLDNESNCKYYYDELSEKQMLHLRKSYSHPYNLADIITMRNALTVYGCKLVSLSPFIGLGHEGHKFSTEEITENELWRGEYKPNNINI